MVQSPVQFQLRPAALVSGPILDLSNPILPASLSNFLVASIALLCSAQGSSSSPEMSFSAS
jgi:hypothetical protein